MISTSELKYFSSLKQKKYREQENKFLIEGFHLIEECLSSSFHIETLFVNEDLREDNLKKILSSAEKKKIRIEYLPEKHFEKLSETESSQGIAAVVQKPDKKKALKLMGNVIVALDRINDPGNLGTILRTCHWFGVKTVLISKDSVDLYNSKVLRSTQGSIFHVSIFDNIDLKHELIKTTKSGYNVYLLDPKSKQTIDEFTNPPKSIFVFGSESEGISEELKSEGYQSLAIKGYSGCESLNVAVSCGIVLQEALGNDRL